MSSTRTARVVQLLIADGSGFVSRPVEALHLTLAGIAGDRHAGPTRSADARTPWHRRGAPIANTRQVSLVSVEDCAEIAALLEVETVDPALLGANVVVAGIPGLSLMAPGMRLQAPSGATLFVTEQNTPCRFPAEVLASVHKQPRIVSLFPRVAVGRRGLVALVEREGMVRLGDDIRCFPSPATVTQPPVPSAQRRSGGEGVTDSRQAR